MYEKHHALVPGPHSSLCFPHPASGRLNVKNEELDAMMKEASGPINFTVFLTMFGEKLKGESSVLSPSSQQSLPTPFRDRPVRAAFICPLTPRCGPRGRDHRSLQGAGSRGEGHHQEAVVSDPQKASLNAYRGLGTARVRVKLGLWEWETGLHFPSIYQGKGTSRVATVFGRSTEGSRGTPVFKARLGMATRRREGVERTQDVQSQLPACHLFQLGGAAYHTVRPLLPRRGEWGRGPGDAEGGGSERVEGTCRRRNLAICPDQEHVGGFPSRRERQRRLQEHLLRHHAWRRQGPGVEDPFRPPLANAFQPVRPPPRLQIKLNWSLFLIGGTLGVCVRGWGGRQG